MKKTVILVLIVSFFSLYHGDFACSAEKRDTIKAFLLSFAIPGLGQYYAGSPGKAKIFIAAELAIWGGYYYNSVIKQSYRNDYIMHAVAHSAVNPFVPGTSNLNIIGAYNSSFDYSRHLSQTSSFNDADNVGMTWEWDSEQNRFRFKNLRERELEYENYMKYCIAGVILNHFLSGLNAAKLVNENNENTSMIFFNPEESGLSANYIWTF